MRKLLATVAGVLTFCAFGLSEAGQIMTVSGYLAMVEDAGYVADAFREPNGDVNIQISKEGKTEKGHGILVINWDQKSTWMFKYRKEGEILSLSESNSKVETRPYWGDWTVDQSIKATLPYMIQIQADKLELGN